MAKHSLKGSERTELVGSKNLGQYDLKEKIEVRLTLRRQHEAELRQQVNKLELGEEIPPLDRKTFAQLYSTSPEDLSKVRAFASEHGLEMVKENPVASSVILRGTVAQLQEVFEVKLSRYEHPKGGYYRGRTGTVYIPEELRDIVTAVLGMDSRPQVHRHGHGHRRGHAHSHAQAIAPSTIPSEGTKEQQQPIAFTPPDLAALYNFPEGDGKGQCIGIVEFADGYRESDLSGFFSRINVAQPTFVTVDLRGAGDQALSQAPKPNFECTLDLEICGSLAPGAKFAVYFANNDEMHTVDAYVSAIHDETNQPSVLSISWSNSESEWTGQAGETINAALQAAAVLGITVCVSSGDGGSSNGTKDNVDEVNFISSSPYVLSCGGTRLLGTEQSVEKEVVWNDGDRATGGGISKFFPVPPWQKGLSAARTVGPAKVLTFRGLPDVAGDASGFSGYQIFFDGHPEIAAGTSATTPLWAALIARINAAKNKSVGFINPKLYRKPEVCHSVTEGNNGSYAAAPGWDACTGLGSPVGQKIFDLL